MRSIFNEAAKQSEEIIEAEIYLPTKFKDRVLEKVTKHMSGFTKETLFALLNACRIMKLDTLPMVFWARSGLSVPKNWY